MLQGIKLNTDGDVFIYDIYLARTCKSITRKGIANPKRDI